MSDINLLPSEDKVSDKLGSLQKKLTVFSVVVLGGVAAFTIATLVMFTTAKAEETDLKDRVRTATEEVASQQINEDLITVVDKKTKSASRVLGERIVYTEVLKKTAELMPLGVAFSDLKLDGLKMSAAATAATSADVAKLVSSFVTTDEGKKLFSSMSIDSLATDAQGKYAFSVSMVLNPIVAQEVQQ